MGAVTSTLIAGSGIFVGLLLHYIAEEEVKSHRCNIKLLSYVILSLILLFSLFMEYLVIFFMSTFAMVLLFTRDEYRVAPVLGVVAAVASFKHVFPVLALVFILGFPMGSIAIKSNRWDSLVKCHIPLYFLFVFFSLFTGFLL